MSAFGRRRSPRQKPPASSEEALFSRETTPFYQAQNNYSIRRQLQEDVDFLIQNLTTTNQSHPEHHHHQSHQELLGQTPATTTTTTTTTKPTHHQFHQLPEAQRECLIQQQFSQDFASSSSNCSFDDLADFNPKELNFSDLQLLWTIKEPLNIFFRVALVSPIILLGILGNLTIIYSMCKFKPFRSKPTNIFILNMAIADLLTTLVCPSAALFSYIYQFYVLGSFICRIEGFVKITCFLVSSYSLIVLSSDWLLCVIKPCRKRISIEQSWLALITIWITSVIMASPLFFWRKLRHRQWKDLVEVWCCELIQYTKYYWVVINFFLIYLPTFFMTIVLVIILAQMDKFEAKLRRSRSCSQSNGSLTINMNYRRRIVKILFTYLLTSMICWTPLQVFIIYRHFRSQSTAAAWFFELNFFTSLSASLTAATNPIIFGFLSQPFRKVVRKTLMFKFFDKIMTTNSAKNNNSQNNRQNQEIFVIASPAPPHQANNNNNLKWSPRTSLRPASQTAGRKFAGNRKQAVARSASSKRTRNSSSRPPTTNTAEQPQNTDNNHNQKRVSFSTTNNSRKLVGRENKAFAAELELSRRNRPGTSGCEVNTTSFIQSQLPATRSSNSSRFRNISAVSMDSINIEENLAEENGILGEQKTGGNRIEE